MHKFEFALLAMLMCVLTSCGNTDPGQAVLLQVEVARVDVDAGLIHGAMRNAGDVALVHGMCPAMLQRNTDAGWTNVPEEGPPSCPAVGFVLEPGERFEFVASAPAGVEGCQFRLQVAALPSTSGATVPEGDRDLLLGSSEPFCLR